MSYLQVKQLSKRWDAFTAVDDISFNLNKNEFIALLGPSGCGKSTTLNMVAGLEEPTAGTIIINDKDITHSHAGKRGISMVFQSYALFPHLNVSENIIFGLKARKVAKTEQQKRLNEALELVNLQDVKHKKPVQLSGGQRQRVALARAIVSQAPLCLMDEPLSNLDAKLRQSMRSEIRQLQKKLGLSVLYVTHDQIEAMSMADEIILLNAGKIEQKGKPQELYNNPASVFVAQFIGSPPMNILKTLDEKVLLGIRPENIHLCDADATNSLKVLVKDCDYQGADTLLTVYTEQTHNDKNIAVEQEFKISLTGHHHYPNHSELFVWWDDTQLCFFDSHTKQRI